MTFHAKSGGVIRTITGPAVRVAGVWQNLTNGYVRVAGVWREFFVSSLTGVGISPSSWLQSFTNVESPQTMGFEANPIGGTAPFSYLWSVTNTGGGTLSFVGGTTSKTCTLQAAGSNDNCTGDLKCTVTDAASTVKEGTAGINVQFGVPP